ncbi:MAG TPA: IS66 family transposase [Steroidobacteraceae bacterium]|nr:IS66 family transposase [Steroidobacteraceae bacterium]HUA23685.1 IS66 family transposase [Steroidobacteraceae bacterium]
MQSAASTGSSMLAEVRAMSAAELAALLQSQAEKITVLEHEIEWFRRQVFGQKSERFAPEADLSQMHLGEAFPVPATPLEEHKKIAAHTRRTARTDGAESGEDLKFFDESKVPVQTITLLHADLQGVPEDQYEVISEKVTHRIAQRPGAYHVIAYRRPVVKLKATGKILSLPAPEGVLQDSRADVSFAAGLLMDEFAWHLPLYRQHQRLEACGIKVSRPWLTQLAQALISLLTPIYDAQLASIRSNRVIAMDETPIKAGRSGHGKMHTGYFWPIYGEHDEVCFPFHSSRSADFVCQALSIKPLINAVLLTDGYAAYKQYAEKTGIRHALCWSHARRGFFEALSAEPTGAAEALEQIKALYAVEERIRDRKLTGEARQLHRLTHGKPLVELFFEWVDLQLKRQGFTPSNPFIQALNYVRERRLGLEIFLADPDALRHQRLPSLTDATA